MKNLVDGKERLKEEKEGMREHEESGRGGWERMNEEKEVMRKHEESGRGGGEIERGTRGHERA